MALVALPIFREATEKENSLVNSHKPFKMVMWINDQMVRALKTFALPINGH